MLGTVLSTRDVAFNEDERFDGNLEHLKDDIREVDRDDLVNLLDQVREEEDGNIFMKGPDILLYGEDEVEFTVGPGRDVDFGADYGVEQRSNEGSSGASLEVASISENRNPTAGARVSEEHPQGTDDLVSPRNGASEAQLQEALGRGETAEETSSLTLPDALAEVTKVDRPSNTLRRDLRSLRQP